MERSCPHYSQVTALDTHIGVKAIMIDRETGELTLINTPGGIYTSAEEKKMDYCDKAFPGAKARIHGVDMLLEIDHVRDACKGTFGDCPVFKGELNSNEQ